MSDLRRVLILSCTARKRIEPELMPALERYDGPTFRVIRKYRQQYPKRLPDLYILSAQYGLIAASHEIPNYDLRLTPVNAALLNPTILRDLSTVWGSKLFDDLCICITRDYEQMILGWESIVPKNVSTRVIRGTPGRKLSELHEWLYQGAQVTLQVIPTGIARIRGVDLHFSAEQVLASVRRNLILGDKHATECQTWCVLIDGQTVAPKWIVSQLSGLPVSAFGGTEARRVLERLGVQVTRI